MPLRNFYHILLTIACIGVATVAKTQTSFTMDKDAGCAPFTVNFTNTSPGGTDWTYTWNFGDGNTSNAFDTSYTYQVPGTYVVVLEAEDSTGSVVTPSYDTVNSGGLINAPELCMVTVDSTSSHNIIVWEKPYPQGLTQINVYRDSSGIWNFVGSVDPDSLSQLEDTAAIDPNTNSYIYKISFEDTCGESPLSAYHATVHLAAFTLWPSPDVHLIWVHYSGYAFNGYNILRDTTGNGNYSLIATVSDTINEFVDTTNPPSGTTYMIEVDHPAGCTATRAKDYNSSRSNHAGIADGSIGNEDVLLFNKTGLKVFPNPTEDRFFIKIESMLFHGVVQLFDITGKQLITKYINNIGFFELDISAFPTGVYHLRVSSDKAVFNKKIFKL